MEFMEHGATINSEVYCETLKKLRRAIQNKQQGLLISESCFYMTTLPLTLLGKHKICCIISNGTFFIIPRTAPVSYTHLDVYKRQLGEAVGLSLSSFREGTGCHKLIQ